MRFFLFTFTVLIFTFAPILSHKCYAYEDESMEKFEHLKRIVEKNRTGYFEIFGPEIFEILLNPLNQESQIAEFERVNTLKNPRPEVRLKLYYELLIPEILREFPSRDSRVLLSIFLEPNPARALQKDPNIGVRILEIKNRMATNYSVLDEFNSTSPHARLCEKLAIAATVLKRLGYR